MSRTHVSLAGLLAAVVLFFAVNIAANATLRSSRIDLTAEKLYTITEGSRNIVRDLKEPIRLYLYFSARQATSLPVYKIYGQRVREFLEEYVVASGGKVSLKVIDPEPFSEEQDSADQAGLTALPSGQGDGGFYFGLVGTNSTDDQEVLPYFNPSTERSLEYDVSRLLWTLAHPERKVVGLVSSLPVAGGAGGNPFTGGRGTPPWQVHAQLSQLFDVRSLGTTFEDVPADVDVLMVVHPKGLSEPTLYAIDQFVLRGGRALVFVDPQAEVDEPPPDPTNPMAAMNAQRSSELGRLMNAWGIELVADKVAADETLALEVQTGSAARPKVIRNVTWIQPTVAEGCIDERDVAVLGLDRLIFASPGILRQREGATTTFQSLIQTTEDSMAIDRSRLAFYPDHEKLLTEFVPEGRRLTLAARVTGPASSAFPEGRPAAPTEGAEVAAPAEAGTAEHVAESVGQVNVVVVADVDLLEDRFWIRAIGQPPLVLGYQRFAQNGDFAINAIDNLSGSDDLISVRGRGEYARPFLRVQEIEREASKSYLEQEQGLQQELRDTESRLASLQRERGDQSSIMLTPEQAQEIRRFEQQALATRKKLRDVQHSMRKDIEALGARIKWVNIGLMPALISVLAVTLLGRRARRPHA